MEALIPPLPSLVESAKGLGHFPLPKLAAAVYEFWVFKDSVGDSPALPAVALQIHALIAYSKWLQLLERLNAPGLEKLPRTPYELTGAQQIRHLMRTLRRLFENNPGFGPRVAGLIDREEAQEVSPEMRSLLKALTRLYDGNPHRYINFYGPPGTITTIPYQAVIKGGDPNLKEGALDFTNKIVFVGFSDFCSILVNQTDSIRSLREATAWNGRDLPAIKASGRDQHGEVGLAAGALRRFLTKANQ